MLAEPTMLVHMMKRAARFYAGFTAVTALAIACTDDETPHAPPSIEPDASRLDGSVGSPIDADGGASDGHGGAPSVTVTVNGALGPKSDVRVVFHDSAGAVLESKLTGADGKATSTGALPAMASAVLTGESHILTWMGVEDGDDLTVFDPGPIVRDVPLGHYAVSAPTPLGGADRYAFIAGACETASSFDGPEETVPLFRDCVREPGTMLVRAQEGPFTRGYSFKKGNLLPTDGGTVEITTSPWANPLRFEVAHGLGEFAMTDLHEISDHHGYRNVTSTRESDDLTVYTIFEGFGDELQVSVATLEGGGVLAKRFAPASRVEFNPADLPPAFSKPSFEASTPRRPTIAWATRTTETDGGMVYLTFGPTGSTIKRRWTFVVPPATTRVEAPAMPSELDGLWSSEAGAIVYAPPQVVFLESDALPSYADFRRRPPLELDWQPSAGGPLLPALPAAGYYRALVWRE